MKNKIIELREKYQKFLVASEAEWKDAKTKLSYQENVNLPQFKDIAKKCEMQNALYEQFISELKILEETPVH